jgi:hypothetical protein
VIVLPRSVTPPARVGDERAPDPDPDEVDADVTAEASVFDVGDVARQLAEGGRLGDAPFGSVEGDEGLPLRSRISMGAR